MTELDYDATDDPFAGMESIAVSVPQVDALYVSQPTDTKKHRVKLATTVKRGKATFYVWECECGFSSALHESQGVANAAYLAHKGVEK